QCRAGQPAPVRWIEKRGGANHGGARRPGRVGGDDVGAVLFAERGDVTAQGSKSVAAVFDKHSGAGAARQGFETERAGTGKGVKHRPASERQSARGKGTVRQDVEQGLARPIAG